MKTNKSKLHKFCNKCYRVYRKNRLYMYCKANNRHKQRQGK